MGWIAVLLLNGVIAVCYVLIAGLIAQGLVRTHQVRTNPLALATATIFVSCAIHHAHHALHLLWAGNHADVQAVRAVFGEWHSVAIDAVGAVVAVTYLGLRRSYKALLNTPAMFDDAVRVEAERHWREQALTDQLTQIPNRAAYQHLADDLALDEQGDDVAVLFIDLDGFKQINDRFGHDAGDRLLQDTAQRLVAALKDGEHVFRLGGDEFVVVCTDAVERARVGEVVRRFQRLISLPHDIRGGDVVIDASIGIAVGPAADGVERLVREADAGMYEIKGRGITVLPNPREDSDLPTVMRR